MIYADAVFADRLRYQLTMFGNRLLIGLSRLLHAHISYYYYYYYYYKQLIYAQQKSTISANQMHGLVVANKGQAENSES